MIKREFNILPTPKELADCFARMSDEDQAQFFIEVAAEMGKWGSYKREMQLCSIGGHLKTCSCSTQEARDLVENLAEFTKLEAA